MAATFARQPFFEGEDIKADSPWQIEDPTVSTAVHATLHSPTDAGHFICGGLAGQRTLLTMTIPQTEGQDDFALTVALMGAGLPTAELRSVVGRPSVRPTRESWICRLRRDRHYLLRALQPHVLLGEQGVKGYAARAGGVRPGRVAPEWRDGEKEQLRGDLTFPLKMRSYWRPVGPEPSPQASPVACLAILVVVPVSAVVLVVCFRVRRRRVSNRDEGSSTLGS